MEKQLDGYLYKQGVGIGLGKGFKKRYFKVDRNGTSLLYFKGKSESTEIGSINLVDALSCVQDQSRDSKFHFRIHTPKRTWNLSSETEEQMNYWLDGINRILNVLKQEDTIDGSGDRRSIRMATMENRIRDLESRDELLKKALALAASKIGVDVDQLLSEAASDKPAHLKDDKPQISNEVKVEEIEKEIEKEVEKDVSKQNNNKKEDDEEDDDVEEYPNINRFRAKVLYDYTAQQNYEMTIRVGEIISVLSKHGNGWWLGATSDGKQGYFPGSYVNPIDE